MRVLLAECAGACYGVQRALDLARGLAETGQRAQTLGPLIHNPLVVKSLEQEGVGVAADPSHIDSDVVVIRSHGVTPQVMREVEARGVRIVDATCPFVERAQKASAQLAREVGKVVVVGEDGHPEVESLFAHAIEQGADVVVAGSADDIPECMGERVGVVVQTTQTRGKLDEVVSALRAGASDVVVKDTICNATSKRQEAAARIAEQVDAMMVIGGKNSSNTTRLYEICKEHAPRAYHVESPEEIQTEWFDGCVTVGVTAGASTPDDQIRVIVEVLESL